MTALCSYYSFTPPLILDLKIRHSLKGLLNFTLLKTTREPKRQTLLDDISTEISSEITDGLSLSKLLKC